jgi:hypothetical protein
MFGDSRRSAGIERHGRREESRTAGETVAKGFDADSNDAEVQKHLRTRIGVGFVIRLRLPAGVLSLLNFVWLGWVEE